MMKSTFCALSLMAILLASSAQASAGVRATGAQHTGPQNAIRQSAPLHEGAVAGTWSWIADLIHGWLDQRSN